jgi:hypothetical protein
MKTHATKTSGDKSQASADSLSQSKSNGVATFQLVDQRPAAIAQRKIQEMADQKVAETIQLSAIGTVQLGKKKHAGKAAKSAAAAVAAGSRARVAGFGQNWSVLAWRTHVRNLGMSVMPGAGTLTTTGKRIFHLTNGHEIVCDLSGYWRHFDSATGSYFDKNGIASAVLADTHFWNSSSSKKANA